MFIKSKEADKWFDSQGLEMVRQLGIKSGWTVLDIGCGYGSYTLPLTRAVGKDGRVIAVDVSAEALKVTEKQLKKRGISADNFELRRIEGTPRYGWITDGSLDAVWLFDVLQHIEERDLLLSEISRMLRAAGRLYINPSEMMHPGEVDYGAFLDTAQSHGFIEIDRRDVDLMHYKKMGHDRVYTLALKPSAADR